MISTKLFFPCTRFAARAPAVPQPFRQFASFTAARMPEPLKKEEVEKGQDPSVVKQYDDSTGTEQKFEDMYKIADKLKIGMLGTYRSGVGVG